MRSISTALLIVMLAGFLNLAALAGLNALDAQTGQVLIAGCRKCEDNKSKTFWVCLDTPETCLPDACLKWTYYWAQCKKTGEEEMDDCEFIFKGSTILKRVAAYYADNPKPTCDPKKTDTGIPDGDCVDVGAGNYKCVLGGSCGTKKVPKSDRADGGRYTCKT